MNTLGSKLLKEQARVRELILLYNDPLLKGAGTIAAKMMEQSLRKADEAFAFQNIKEMMIALKDLEGYKE